MWAGMVRKTGKSGLWTASKPIDRPPASKRRKATAALILTSLAAPAMLEPASAAGPGTNEIRIGNTIDYTGPVRAAGVVGKVISAYFDKVNAEGGVNGRRIKFISYDDTYNPAKTVELTRKLIEEDRVLFIFASVGTATNAAVQSYLNANKIPQLFSISGSSMLDRPHEFPWSMA